MQTDLNELYAQIQYQLHEEYQKGNVIGIRDWEACSTGRIKIKELLDKLSKPIQELRDEVKELPKLANMEYVDQARAILDMRDLAFLEIDTTGLSSDDEICRVLLLDANKNIIEDIYIKPEMPLEDSQAFYHNGIKLEMLETAASFKDMYLGLREILCGRYLVSFGMNFDQQALRQTCKKYGLPVIYLVGDCLQKRAKEYWQDHSIKLETACEYAGAALPRKPEQTAYHRAQGQLDVLLAMTQAIYNLQVLALPPELSTDLEDLDDHPF